MIGTMNFQNSTILFQGDSITDCRREKADLELAVPTALGSGYAAMAAGHLLADHPDWNLRILNRGISGNRITDLYSRILIDTINLQPNLLSVLIGVNDTWHTFKRQNGVSVPKFETVYRMFLDEVREANPDIALVLCHPFSVPCGEVGPGWAEELLERRQVIDRLAEESGAVVVPFQAMFDEALNEAPPEYWAPDGVHPSSAGHTRMARLWLTIVTNELMES